MNLALKFALGIVCSCSVWLLPAFGQDGLPSITIDNYTLKEQQIFDLLLNPAAPTKPALQHRLYPKRSASVKRNAVTFYYRAVAKAKAIDAQIREYNRTNPDRKKAYLYDSYGEWMAMPLNEIPADRMREYVDAHMGMFAELKRAESSGYCEWNIFPSQEEDVNWYSIELDEVQYLRAICRVISVAVRLAIHDGDFDLAVSYLRYGFKIANDLQSCEVMVASLVGVACSGLMLEELHYLMQQDGSPNMYWPLVDLPKPLVDVSPSIRRELFMLTEGEMFGSVKQRDNASINADGWRFLLINDLEFAMGNLQMEQPTDVGFLVGGFAMRSYPYAKVALIERGFDPQQVESMPVGRVLALQNHFINEMISDELQKSLSFDYSVRLEVLEGVSVQLAQLSFPNTPSSNSHIFPLTGC